MDYPLAQGKVLISNKLNYLIVDNKTVAYQISYEIEKLLRENYLDKNVAISLNVREINW